jgi:hypothetical protein
LVKKIREPLLAKAGGFPHDEKRRIYLAVASAGATQVQLPTGAPTCVTRPNPEAGVTGGSQSAEAKYDKVRQLLPGHVTSAAVINLVVGQELGGWTKVVVFFFFLESAVFSWGPLASQIVETSLAPGSASRIRLASGDPSNKARATLETPKAPFFSQDAVLREMLFHGLHGRRQNGKSKLGHVLDGAHQGPRFWQTPNPRRTGASQVPIELDTRENRDSAMVLRMNRGNFVDALPVLWPDFATALARRVRISTPGAYGMAWK